MLRCYMLVGSYCLSEGGPVFPKHTPTGGNAGVSLSQQMTNLMAGDVRKQNSPVCFPVTTRQREASACNHSFFEFD